MCTKIGDREVFEANRPTKIGDREVFEAQQLARTGVQPAVDLICVGDYRYIKCSVKDYYNDYNHTYHLVDVIKIGKILTVEPDGTYIVSFFELETGFIRKHNVCGKWKPNWFWRMLGY